MRMSSTPSPWGPLMTTDDPVEGKSCQDKYQDWITDVAKMRSAAPDAIYMHPLPADRDIEVTNEVMMAASVVLRSGPRHRLHAQRGVMALTMW